MLILLGGCAGDFGRPQSLWVTDEALAIEVGQPLRHVTLPITIYGRTDDEKSLRKYAYPLLVPPYQNERLLRLPIDFDYAAAVVGLGPGYDPGSYTNWLMAFPVRSQVARYTRMTDDIRDDMIRIDRFHEVARRVADMDLRREQALAQVTAVSDVDRANAVARIAENGSLIGRVSQCLGVRAEAYRVALERLVIAQPSPMAADADRALTALRRRIAEVAAAPVAPVALVTKP